MRKTLSILFGLLFLTQSLFCGKIIEVSKLNLITDIDERDVKLLRVVENENSTEIFLENATPKYIKLTMMFFNKQYNLINTVYFYVEPNSISQRTVLNLTVKDIAVTKMFEYDIANNYYCSADIIKYAERGNLDSIFCTTLLGTSVLTKDIYGQSPLHVAAGSGHTYVIRYLLEKNASNINSKNNSGLTPLHLASSNGQLEAVKYLVKMGADMTIKNNAGQTALHRAGARGYLDIVQYLYQHGANIDTVDIEGKNVLHLAAMSNKVNIIQYLVESGIKINAKDKNGNTALHLATSLGNIEALDYLVKVGADMNAKNSLGLTPLHEAAYHGNVMVTKMLVSLGANVFEEAQSDTSEMFSGKTPLNIAYEMGNVDIVDILTVQQDY